MRPSHAARLEPGPERRGPGLRRGAEPRAAARRSAHGTRPDGAFVGADRRRRRQRHDTPAVLARLAAAEPRLRPLRQPARSGQTAALVAGFRAARGALVATLDADLQCPPAELPALLAALDTADLACGIRAHRHDPMARRLASALSNLARRAVVAPRVRDLACPLRVFRAEALRRVEGMTPLFDGAHRWLPALFVLAGLRVVQRPVAHQPRRAGVSKYTTAGRAGPVAREL